MEDLLGDFPPEVAEEVRAFIARTGGPVTPTDPRRHHYVPQFYLRRFARQDGDKSTIATVPIAPPSTPRQGNVADTAVIRDFYTVVGDDNEDTVAVEKLLAMVEGAAAGPLERLAGGVFFPPNDHDRMIIGLLIALQIVRGPDARRHMEAMADLAVRMTMSLEDRRDQAIDFLRQRDGHDPTAEAVDEFFEDVQSSDWQVVPSQNDLVKLMLEQAQALAPYVTMRKWCLVRFPEPGLVTSDRPVMLTPTRVGGDPSRESAWPRRKRS